MNTKNLFLTSLLIFTSAVRLMAAGPENPSIAFIDIDTRNSRVSTPSNPVTAMTRVELEKLKRFQLLDKYDLEYLTSKDSIKINNCYSRLCLTELGKKLKVEKMFTGSVEEMSDQIIVTFKILDVQNGQFEKVQVNEFLNIPAEIKSMIKVTMNDMFGIQNEADLVSKLTRKDDYDNAVNNPYELRLRSDGPRMGFTYFTGSDAAVLKAPSNAGGFNAHPVMFQFGYQFERQYLNEGNFQALFEFVPMLTGLDQGLLIPSFTFMNGLRSNKSGWEFAFGPTVAFAKKAEGFYDRNNNWHLKNDTTEQFSPRNMETRMDSRGDVTLHTNFVFAFGKTFKSGKLNIPVNGYIIPSKNGTRVGVSFGFNAKERYTFNGKVK